MDKVILPKNKLNMSFYHLNKVIITSIEIKEIIITIPAKINMRTLIKLIMNIEIRKGNFL